MQITKVKHVSVCVCVQTRMFTRHENSNGCFNAFYCHSHGCFHFLLPIFASYQWQIWTTNISLSLTRTLTHTGFLHVCFFFDSGNLMNCCRDFQPHQIPIIFIQINTQLQQLMTFVKKTFKKGHGHVNMERKENDNRSYISHDPKYFSVKWKLIERIYSILSKNILGNDRFWCDVDNSD